MNTNYQIKLDEILENINGQTLLLHSCCAPCSSYVLEYLSNYFKITVFYYNPNISPDIEYRKRVKEQKEFISMFKSKYPIDIIEGDYETEKFDKISAGLENEIEGGKRCFKCYELRLRKTDIVAKENNYDYFGTTLTVSPYKNSKKLNEIGELLQDEYKINYLFSDFKKKNGYKRSIELSKEYNLYRQDYCGCEFSKNFKNKENNYAKETI